MLANYGYKDGAGEFYISIETEKCDGCAECVKACPQGVFECSEDMNDPFRREPIAVVSEPHRNKLKYSCAGCKPPSGSPSLPCMKSCKKGAIGHSW